MHDMPNFSQPSRLRRPERGGFTLIELLIVIGIVLLISAIVLGTITRLGASNRRMACQSNLSQIYQACRLYQQDEGGFPFYFNSSYVKGTNPPSLGSNIGLWALYSFPDSGNVNRASATGPVGRYVRSSRVFHCPQDNLAGEVPLVDPLDNTRLNDKYLSYQQIDDNGTDSDSTDDQPSYLSVRNVTKTASNWERQLATFNQTVRILRAPSDNTVVTWCRFHRKAVGGRDFDNVLFYDGSVQLLPRQPDDLSLGWERLPKDPS